MSSSRIRRRIVFSYLVGERELECISLFLQGDIFVVFVEVGILPNYVNSCILCVCLLFNFRLFTVINLSPRVLSAQQVVLELG